MTDSSSTGCSKEEQEAIDMESRVLEEMKRNQRVGKNNKGPGKQTNIGISNSSDAAIKPRPRPTSTSFSFSNPSQARHNHTPPQTLSLSANNNHYKKGDLMMFDASVGNEKTEILKSALPHLYEAKLNPNPIRAVPFSFMAGTGPSAPPSTPDLTSPWQHKPGFSTTTSFNRFRLNSPVSPGYPSNTLPAPTMNFFGPFQPPGQGLIKSQSLNTFPEFKSSHFIEAQSVRGMFGQPNSASANTSPVHQAIHQKLQSKQRNAAEDYSIVTFPKPNDRPLTKLGIDILPDKAKISPSPSKHKNSSGELMKTSSTVSISNELIDLNEEDFGNRLITKVAVGEFDPLANRKIDASEQIYFSSSKSEGSLYLYHDPFDYLHDLASKPLDDGISEAIGQPSQQNEPFDDADKSFLNSKSRRSNYPKVYLVPSTPGAADEKKVERRKKEREKYYEKTELVVGISSLYRETDASKIDPELKCFVSMLTDLRSQFKFDGAYNEGITLSPTIETVYMPDTSVKLVVKPHVGKKSDFSNLPSVNFTCNVDSTMSHILWKVLMDLEDRGHVISVDEKFIFSISGVSEYVFCDETKLQSLSYVHQCYKFDRDVELTLMQMKDLKRPHKRTRQDDVSDTVIRPQEIAPHDAMKAISYDELKILLEYLDNEIKRMRANADTLLTCTERGVLKALRPTNVIQNVKHLCALLGCVETLEVSETCANLEDQCRLFEKSRVCLPTAAKLEIVEELADGYAKVEITSGVAKTDQHHVEALKETLLRVKDVVQKLLTVYMKTFRVNFGFANLEKMGVNSGGETNSYDSKETLLLRVCALHRLQPDWMFDEYMVTVEIFHGTCPVTNEPLATQWKPKSTNFYERVVFDVWIDTIGIFSLPRESRIVLTLFGRKSETVDRQIKYKITDVGWASLQLFNFENYLSQGSFLLPLWPSMETERKIGPAPDSSSHPFADSCPLISIELPELVIPVKFPLEIPSHHPPRDNYIFEELGPDLQAELQDLCDQDLITFRKCKTESREVFWEKRYYLRDIPGSLPKVLLSANSWDYASLPVLYGTLEFWKRPSPMDILQLFLPCFPDTRVKEVAIAWLNSFSSDDLVDFLPQMVEALKYETWSASPLAKLLLERSLMSPRVAHSLYLLLNQSLPGESPQNSYYSVEDDGSFDSTSRMKVARYKRRLQMFMRALYIILGSSLRNSFLKQQELIRLLRKAALEVRESKDGIRMTILQSHLKQIDAHLKDDNSTMVPLSIGLVANSLDTGASSYFPSNTLPLKLIFMSENGDPIPAMFKVGDDLRQDQLTMQMVKLMDKIWLREGLDLKMVTFSCVPTGYRHGMVELVTNAKTLREIQVTNHGAVGSFRDSTITEWLKKHNTSQIEFNTAVTNFTRSCAGYSIVTYILGICDRHNDNIMLRETGHLFHIDFGKFLGDYQTFKGFKRDRSPFVLTQDMLYVINGSNKPSQNFQDFVDLCCKGYNIIRKNGNHLLNMFALMASSGIPGVTHEAVTYVQNALSPDLSSAEAADAFARLIEESLANRFTQVNFFIHNIAQARFNDEGAPSDGESRRAAELLSFSPKTFSAKTDGRIKTVSVYGIQKRYFPERHYLFILKIARHNENGETQIFRTYKEFCELGSKLNRAFPKSGLPSLEKGLHLGRQEVREVAERRKHEVGVFLERLFNLENRISHCDLVYTFFHPILRDEEETDISLGKLKDPHRKAGTSGRQIQGKLKLSLEYRRNSLLILVCHAKDLVVPDVSREEPNSYVKIYLQPDPEKVTKRKTRVIHKNSHPSFMETIEYRITWDILKNRTLQASVWNTDRLKENQFMGAVEIPLGKLNIENKEDAKWYSLTNMKRLSNQRLA